MTGKDAKLEPSSHSNLELQWSAPQLLISATHGMKNILIRNWSTLTWKTEDQAYLYGSF